MNIIEVLEQEQLRSDIPDFRAGDTVKVYVKVVALKELSRCTAPELIKSKLHAVA